MLETNSLSPGYMGKARNRCDGAHVDAAFTVFYLDKFQTVISLGRVHLYALRKFENLTGYNSPFLCCLRFNINLNAV